MWYKEGKQGLMQDWENPVRVFWLISVWFGTIPKYRSTQIIMPIFISSGKKKKKEKKRGMTGEVKATGNLIQTLEPCSERVLSLRYYVTLHKYISWYLLGPGLYVGLHMYCRVFSATAKEFPICNLQTFPGIMTFHISVHRRQTVTHF